MDDDSNGRLHPQKVPRHKAYGGRDCPQGVEGKGYSRLLKTSTTKAKLQAANTMFVAT